MQYRIDKTGSLSALRSMLLAFDGQGVQSLLVLACESNNYDHKKLDQLLRTIQTPLAGGLFPFILHGSEKLERGCIVLGLEAVGSVHVIPGMSQQNVDYEQLIEATLDPQQSFPTLLVLLDGLSTRIGSFIDGLYSVLGLEINYIGGGAGSMDLVQKPCLLSNHGLLEDSALLVPIELASGVGVSHGWLPADGPFRITEASGCNIISLNWKPAHQVYKRLVESLSGQKLDRENFFMQATKYPFGIAKIGTEFLVRDPIGVTDNDTLICVGDVPPGSYINVLKGSEHSLILAARQACNNSRLNYQGSATGAFRLFIDCLSRVLYLGESFRKEIEAVSEDGLPLFGACTLGEIANNGRDYLEFYNKTAVVATLGEE